VGLLDYKDSSGNTIDKDKVVFVKIADGNWGNEYYVGFKMKIGINLGTVEGGNQVMVVKRNVDHLSYGNSTLMAKLNAGDTYMSSQMETETYLR